MIDGLPPIGDGHQPGNAQPSATKGAPPTAVPGPVDDGGFPATPPTEVLDSLDRAARVLGELDRKNVSVSLRHDEETQQLRVKLTQDGSPAATELSNSSLLNLLDGDMTELDT